MATITTDLICNLNQPVAATFLHGNLFSQDNAGNTINVHVMDNGEPATIGGTVSANVIRADGNTVAVSGSLSGNQCSVVLPQACYAVPGRVEIIIKLTQSTTITTIAAIVANVYRSTTDTVVDPGTIIPSIQSLIEEIEDAVDSIPVDYSDLLATIAADYSSSKTYQVGQYAWQGGVLKRCIVPITTAETYTSAHWTDAVIGDDLSALKSAIDSVLTKMTIADFSWTIGKSVSSSGSVTNSAGFALADSIQVDPGAVIVNETTGTGIDGKTTNLHVNEYNSGGTWLRRTIVDTGKPHVVGNDCYSVRIAYGYPGATGVTMTQEILETYFTDVAISQRYLPEENVLLAGRFAKSIENGTDYDTILTPGNYRIGSNASAQSMINCPTSAAHRLIVMQTINASRYMQIILVNNSDSISTYQRYYDGSTWHEWGKYAISGGERYYLNLEGSNAAEIANGTDYNTIITPGNYRVGSNESAQSMNNCPVRAAHRLIVLQTTNASRYMQIILLNTSERISTYQRYYDGTSWNNWERYATGNDVTSATKNVASADVDNLVRISTATNYNDVDEVGCYEIPSSALAKKMTNCPVKIAHRLYVVKLYQGATSTYQVIVSSNANLTQYVRYKKNGTWTEWKGNDISPVSKLNPVFNEYNNPYALVVSRIKKGGTAVYSTLPYEDDVQGATSYYAQDSAIDGVIYSSVWRDGLDVFRNLTLETFYSALENPASVLYTKTYTDKNIFNAHSWYGGVCSTYISRLMGFRQYKTTALITDYLQPKPLASIRDISIGDILHRSGHIAIISQIYVDADGAISGVGVSEQTSPQFRTKIVDINDLESYISKNNYTVMVPRDAVTISEMEPATFNGEIIFERGNNTYITAADIADGAWFYIPNASTIYWKKDNGSFASVAVSTLPTKTVNEVTVYNLASVFSGVGDYVFTDDVDAVSKCLIKMISVGTLSLSGNVLTLSGWQNCVPYNYYIVREIPRTDPDQDYAFDPTEGYRCTYTSKSGDIDVEPGATTHVLTIPDGDISGYDRYKVWVEYDTGIGYKQAFSNLVVVS